MPTPGLRVDQVANAITSVAGVSIEMLKKAGGSTQSVTSGTFVDLTDVSGSFVAPVAGLYDIVLRINGVYGGSIGDSGAFRAVFDAAGTPQYIGASDYYSTYWTTSVLRPDVDIRGSLILTAGTHTIKVEALKNGGLSLNIDSLSTFIVNGTLVSGSGAGGTIVTPATPSANPTNIYSSDGYSSYKSVPGLSFSITTSANESVQLNFKGNAYAAGSSANAYVQWYIDGVALDAPAASTSVAGSTSIDISFSRTHTLSAGSHTITIQAKQLAADWQLYDCHASIVQYRGGLVHPETKRAVLTYNAAGAIDVAAAPGEPSTVNLTLQDGKQRYFSGTLAWAFATGVADLGLDTGTEASSTWYYLYAVPKSTDDSQLSVRASVTAPATGPTGYTNFKYLGAFRNDGSSNIIKFYQIGSTFETAVPQGTGFTEAGPADTVAQTYTLTDYIPATAIMVDIHFYFQASGAGTMFGFSYGDQDVTSATTMWNTAKLRASAPFFSSGQSARGFIPTTEATKRITYFRDAYAQSRIDTQGWIDRYLT